MTATCAPCMTESRLRKSAITLGAVEFASTFLERREARGKMAAAFELLARVAPEKPAKATTPIYARCLERDHRSFA